MTMPEWLPARIWADFKANRAILVKLNRKAKPFTEIAERRAIAKLGRLREGGNDPVAVIDRSIDKGWEGLFALPDDQRGVFKEQRSGEPQGMTKCADALTEIVRRLQQ
jgi:hypothetical protein